MFAFFEEMIDYYIKEQLLKVFQAWGAQEAPPGKGRKVVVAFPVMMTPNLATVTVTAQKSTYGKTLYRVETT